MKRLTIDEKWSVMYDPSNNDRPVESHRYLEFHSPFSSDNSTVAMFYALLEKNKELQELNDEMELNEVENCDVETELLKLTHNFEKLEELIGRYTDQRDYDLPKESDKGQAIYPQEAIEGFLMIC